MIHTFTLAIKVNYRVTDYKYFHQQINSLPSLKLIDETNHKKLLIINKKLTSTLTPEEIDNMPVVMFEHIEHCKNGKQTGATDNILIKINLQKILANKGYNATPIYNMWLVAIESILELVCKAIPVIDELNYLKHGLTEELKNVYFSLYQTTFTFSDVDLYAQMASTPNSYVQNLLLTRFSQEDLEVLANPTISNKSKLSIINSTLSLLEVCKLRRMDYTLDFQTDYKYIYMDLINKGRMPPHLDKDHSIYYGFDENNTLIIQSNHAESTGINTNFYSKEKEMLDKCISIPAEDTKEIHDKLRLELQLKGERLKYLVKKKDSTVKERLLKYFVDADVESKELTYYLNRIMGTGQYFTKPKAIEIINSTNYRIDKKQRLINIIEGIDLYDGINGFLSKVSDGTVTNCGKLSTVKQLLRELHKMGVNPVTISDVQAQAMKAITPTYQVSNIGNYVHGVDYLLNPCTYFEMQLQKEQYIQNELMNPNSALVCAIEQE